MAMLQSASNYGGLEATPLAQPGYASQIMSKIYERDFLPEITNTEIDTAIFQCHQQVQVMKAPEVGPWRTYQKNQEMVPTQISAEAICIEICNAAYNAVKIDDLDIRWACERWDPWEEKFLDGIYESFVKMQREWVLTAMIMEADPQNRGSNAGIHKNIDLGARGNPVEVNPQNIALQFTKLQQVLMERLRWRDNEMFVVLPSVFRQTIVMSNYANSEWIGNNKVSGAVDGLWDNLLAGFKVIETINAPFVVEPDGRVCYFVIAGHHTAFAYAANIIDSRIVRPEKTWSAEYQMLAVWGGKMIYPESMAVAYWTFKS